MSARVTLILINEEYQIMTGDIVYKDLIQLDLDVRNTDELFEVMSGRLMELGYVTGDFLESIKEREKEYPTALPIEPYAVAIPHTDPECIKNAFIACIRLKEPIPWSEMAANEVVHMVRFVFLLGFKQEAVGDAHVELLQILVNNCQRPDFMERLRQAANIEAYFNLVLSMEGIG